MPRVTKKIYCYVDETGQDTMGILFLVSIIVAEGEHDSLRGKLQKIESASGKGMQANEGSNKELKELLERGLAKGYLRAV